MSGVSVTPNFDKRIRDLQADYGAQAAVLLEGGEPPPLFTPDGYTDKLTDAAKAHEPFSRDELDEQMRKAYANGQTSAGEATAVGLQVDFLACMERAYRATQGMGRLRAEGHAAARKLGQAGGNGSLAACRDHVLAVIADAAPPGGAA